MNSTYSIINDQFIPAEKAALAIHDLSIQRGYGIFDFFRTVRGKFIFIEDHLDRFFYSASQMRLETGRTREELKSMMEELMARNKMPDSGIRITVTGGYSADGYGLATPNLLITQKPLQMARDRKDEGLRLVSYEHQRQLPQVKTIDYIMAIWLRPWIAGQGADDVLYHQAGRVTEIPRSNFFIVTHDDKIITAGENILKGITRKQVLSIASSKFENREQDLLMAEVRQAKEAFVTSTTKEVLPVLQIDGQPVGDGKPGPVTSWLKKELQALIYG